MTDGAINEMSRILGGLQAEIKAGKDAIDNLNRVWGERERDASNGRQIIHGKIDSMQKEVTMLSAEVENVSKDLTEIKPAIDTFKSARERALGAQHMGKLIWGAFLALAGLAGMALGEFFHAMRH